MEFTEKQIKDPYLSQAVIEQRLLDEYVKYRKLIVAVDFDDTLYDFHQKGFEYPQLVETVRRCNRAGFFVMVFTDLSPGKAELVEQIYGKYGLRFDSINKSPDYLPFGSNGKPYYNILLDDRAGLPSALEALKAVLDHVDTASIAAG